MKIEILRENFQATIFTDLECGLKPKKCIDRLRLAFGDETPSKSSVRVRIGLLNFSVDAPLSATNFVKINQQHPLLLL